MKIIILVSTVVELSKLLCETFRLVPCTLSTLFAIIMFVVTKNGEMKNYKCENVTTLLAHRLYKNG